MGDLLREKDPALPKAQGLGEVAKARCWHRPNQAVPRVIHAQKRRERSWASPGSPPQALKHGWAAWEQQERRWARPGPGPTYLERVGEEHNEVLQVQHQAGIGAVGLQGRAEMKTRL